MSNARLLSMILSALLWTSATFAQVVDPGATAHEQVVRQQSQGLTAPPPLIVTTPNPAQPRVDPGAAYHQSVVNQQRKGKLAEPPKKKGSKTGDPQ